MDDGPFHGEKRINCPITKPDQETVIWNNLKLKVYDKKKNEKAPTVLLQNKQGKILWCIYAIGYKETNITKIRFYRHKGFPFIISRVEGIVNWTYGTEATTWFISRDGKLEEYWYSW